MAMRSGYEGHPLRADGAASGGVPLISRRDWLCFGLLGAGAAVWPVRAGIVGDAAIGRIFLIACAEPNPAQSTPRWIIAIDPKTGTLTKLFDVGLYDGPVRVSPDGRTAAFEGGTPDRRAIMTCPTREGGKATKVADLPRTMRDASPIWSPDGRWLVASVPKPAQGGGWDWETYKFAADGSSRELLPIPPTDEVHDWSPDGQWLLTTRHGRFYIMRPDASEQRQVFRWRGDYPRFSPDGKSFVFTWMMVQRHGIFVMDLDGGRHRPVLEVELGTVASPCWSPDGKELAVVTYELQPKNRAIASARIIVCELVGKGRRVFNLPPGTTPRRPDWR
jgi:Tol biopolymer transport system component